LELEIVAWGRDRESWSIDFRVLQGDPVKPDVWRQLDGVLAETFTHAGNTELSILRLAIDTGYATQEVYDWVRRQSSDRVIAIKGVERLGAAIGTPSHMDVTTSGQTQTARPAGLARGRRPFANRSFMAACAKTSRPMNNCRMVKSIPPGLLPLPKIWRGIF
jgi:phage terminase large subunit GpA-like protein